MLPSIHLSLEGLEQGGADWAGTPPPCSPACSQPPLLLPALRNTSGKEKAQELGYSPISPWSPFDQNMLGQELEQPKSGLRT